MKQEDKELLLKDLCARLPYLVKGLYQWKGNVPFDRELDGRLYDELYLSLYSTEDSSFKPYLRPMLSMTEEEKKEFDEVIKSCNNKVFTCPEQERRYIFFDAEQEDFMNAHHFDYRGLIEKGLALEATEDMY